MTDLLAQAFAKASELPESLQDELARELLAGLVGEARWSAALTDSAETLDNLAEQALKEHEAGRTKEIGFDEL
jgi:predicted thioredoxin/glutaredoxin